jgi:hypothetical protein
VAEKEPEPVAIEPVTNVRIGTEPSGIQREILKEVCEQSWTDVPTTYEPLQAQGVPYGDYLRECQGNLVGMHGKEASNSHICEDIVGDGGYALGCFQINSYYHKTPDECREDFRCSAAWTLNNLVGHGWLPSSMNAGANHYAIQCHNGCGFNNGYWQRVIEKSKKYIAKYGL